jgi:NADH-quinone oxidoreductase subunit A
VTAGYVPIVILAAIAGVFAVGSIAVAALVSPRKPSPAKVAPYESGITPIRLPKAERYPVKFYVVAMLFIVFDIETIFLFPWAVAFRGLGVFGLVEMVVFIGLVFVAYLYVWQKGGLEWDAPRRVARVSVPGVTAGRLPPWVEHGPGEVDERVAMPELAAQPVDPHTVAAGGG